VHFGQTAALSDVSMAILAGEIHTLVGENGAGKSTLLRVLAGVLSATAGSVELAAGVNVEWVPQETNLPIDLTVAEWIFLGRELRTPLRLLDRRAMRRQAESALARVHTAIDPETRIGDLSPAQRKQVQLARALRRQPALLLVDEPTAVLGTSESAGLFAALRAQRDAGGAIVYVSHHLAEVLAIADRVTVLRDGQLVSTDRAGEVDEKILVQRMVGRELAVPLSRSAPRNEVALRCHEISVDHVVGFSLALARGEIVGLAGLMGAGRSEILEALAALRPVLAGRIESRTPPLLLPEDRWRKGLIPTFALRPNICIPTRGWIRASEERKVVAQLSQQLRIRASGSEAPIASLSGGNQQKVLLARMLRRGSEVLLLDEPTAGVDVGGKAEIHALIHQLADQGSAVLIASSDLPELLHLCNRIVALYQGRSAAVVDVAEATEERLAALISGSSPRSGSPPLKKGGQGGF
jgi:ABC-type sugar transport system ATPase subunit